MFKTWSDRNPTPFFGLVGLSSLWMVFVTLPNLLVRTIPVFINQMVTSAVFSAFVQWLKPHTICDYKSSTNRGFAHCSIEWRHSRTCIDYMHVHLIRMMMAVPLQLCTCCIDGSIHIMYYMMHVVCIACLACMHACIAIMCRVHMLLIRVKRPIDLWDSLGFTGHQPPRQRATSGPAGCVEPVWGKLASLWLVFATYQQNNPFPQGSPGLDDPFPVGQKIWVVGHSGPDNKGKAWRRGTFPHACQSPPRHAQLPGWVPDQSSGGPL